MYHQIQRRSNLAPNSREWKICCHQNHGFQAGQHICSAVGMTSGKGTVMASIHGLQHLQSLWPSHFSNYYPIRPQYKKVKVNLRRCLYECDLSCARCWWLLYGNAEPGPGFPSCPAGSCGIRPDGSGIFYLGWPVPDAPVLSGRIHGFQVVINYTNYHQKPAEIFV